MRPAAFALVPLFILGSIPFAAAQSGGTVTGGSANVTINGKPAARAGDTTTDGTIIEGSPNVTINGKPAAILGGTTGCGGVVIGGSANVFINGRPAATSGSATSGCPGH